MDTTKHNTIFFDLDGTLTEVSTWYFLNIRLGITPEEDKALFDQYLKESLSYEAWNRALVELYRSRGVVTQADIIHLAQEVVLRPDAKSTVEALKEKGYEIVILSGSVDTIVSTIAARLGVKEWRATSRLVFNEQDELVDIVASGDEAPAKEILAKEYCRVHDISLSDTYTIDDGGNGLELFKSTNGILLGQSDVLKPFAKHTVATLSEIVPLL